MAPAEVQQWQTLQNGIENLTRATAPMPVPGDNEVLVEIHAVSLNYRDTEVAMGLYTHHKTVSSTPEPLVPCADMCGTILSVGKSTSASASPFKPGDRVLSTFNQSHLTGQIKPSDMASGLGLPQQGVLQTHRVFPVSGLVPAPTHLSDEEASTLPIAAVTAWMCINGMREPGKAGGEGETILLQGTGGVSMAGLQIAVASGATTIVTSSSDEKLERARALGATHTINYRTTPQWADEVLRLTNGNGADIIFECGGAGTLRQSFDCVAFGGLIDCVGYLSGKQDDDSDRTNVNVLALKRNVTLKGILNGPKDRFEEVCRFYEKHGIKPVVDRVFRFEEGREALEYLFAGKHFGKVVVKVKA